MERNWLIRTTQNQILGPVAKAKVLEFLQKGALGLNDEVTSGNGYWFSLKEKDLVEKYLYGDVPQGYNPISESKSVLSRRDNPDKTTSLNTAPANKTQVIKLGSTGPAIIPDSKDLEYPDITMINTTASTQLAAQAPVATQGDELKLPNQDDLEFPDVAMITGSVNSSMSMGHDQMQTHAVESRPIEIKSRPAEKVEAPALQDGPVVYPEDDDLAYPDMGIASSTPAEPEEEELDFKVELPKPAAPPTSSEATSPGAKKIVRDFNNEFEESSGLSLVMGGAHKEPKVEAAPEPAISLVKKEKPKEVQAKAETHHEDKKLLHERKVKASALPAQKESTKDLPKEMPPRSMPEELKKRNDNYLLYILIILVLIILSLFFYYYRTILNKPLPV